MRSKLFTVLIGAMAVYAATLGATIAAAVM